MENDSLDAEFDQSDDVSCKGKTKVFVDVTIASWYFR